MRKQRQSKFVGKQFDNGWRCSKINIAKATLTHKNGGPTYWYAFERINPITAKKEWFRIEGHTATKVYKGLVTVQELYFNSLSNPTSTHEINTIG